MSIRKRVKALEEEVAALRHLMDKRALAINERFDRMECEEEEVAALRHLMDKRALAINERFDRMECEHENVIVIDRHDLLVQSGFDRTSIDSRFCEECEDCGLILDEYNDEKRFRYTEVRILSKRVNNLQYLINEKKKETEEWEESCRAPNKT